MQITGIYHAMILNYVDICPPIIFSSRVSLFVFITLNDRKNKLIFFSPVIVNENLSKKNTIFNFKTVQFQNFKSFQLKCGCNFSFTYRH